MDKGRNRIRISFWICRIDGKEMHELGYLPLYIPEGSDTLATDLKHQEPDSLAWTPDGKRINFMYRGAAYSVPVD